MRANIKAEIARSHELGVKAAHLAQFERVGVVNGDGTRQAKTLTNLIHDVLYGQSYEWVRDSYRRGFR
jgi:hypothetical protein